MARTFIAVRRYVLNAESGPPIADIEKRSSRHTKEEALETSTYSTQNQAFAPILFLYREFQPELRVAQSRVASIFDSHFGDVRRPAPSASFELEDAEFALLS